MEKQLAPFNISRDVTLAAEGMEQKVDDRTIFCTPDPLAASTVSRDNNRVPSATTASCKGSFLDDLSRLSLQSLSAIDLTNQQFNFTFTDNSPREGRPGAGDSGPDLIQFSGATNVGSADEEINKSDTSSVSSRSSMGLIPSEMLNELSASVLPLATPSVDPAKETKHKEVDSSQSTLKEKTVDSHEWSDNSKQDSKDLPWGRSQLETVKKRPLSEDDSREGAHRRLTARGASSLFSGHLLDDVEESEELDQSVHDVELGDEELQQLDADVDFSDLEEDRLSLEEGRESGDEDFDFDEPMLSLPTRGREDREEDDDREGRGVKTLQAELAEAEGRLGEGQESEDEGATALPSVGSTAIDKDFGLDSRYFRKTPMPFAGDGEDTEVATSRSSGAANSQERGAAEGEHLLTKLRRQFMSGDGSENEIDTDDELEAARKSLAVARREGAQGADEEDSDRSDLPLPVGLEEVKASDSGNHGGSSSSSSRNGPPQSHFSFLTRQRAEGDNAHSPVPWDGGGGGDGSSGGDSTLCSDGGGRSLPEPVTRPAFRYVSGAADNPDPSLSGLHALTRSLPSVERDGGLQPQFFMPTSSHSTLHDSEVISPQNLEGSTFMVEDILQSRTQPPPGVSHNKADREPRLDGSGFSVHDGPENPFEGQFAGSFGSFGLGAADEELDNGATDRSVGSGRADVSRQAADRAVLSIEAPSANSTLSVGDTPASDSSSFDGPFRKPRTAAPQKKRIDRKETYNVDVGPKEWKNVIFSGTDGEGESQLERELKELGISVDDKDFHAASDVQAMLDADEKQFEEDNKFSQHHQLALAAEGLAWEDDDSHFSGFLGGEEHAEHLETSIGTYMAARTETLGTLGGDPNIPRPEFGKPVSSPPHCAYPMKWMSPPSTTSSALNSRTEGEGDEEGDKTIVSGDSTLHASDLPSPPKPHNPEASRTDRQNTSTDEQRTAAEDTLREELSSILLDLTQGAGGDLSMENAFSMSSVFEFIKNQSYAKSSDFAAAIVKLSQNKKWLQDSKRGGESLMLEQTLADCPDSVKGKGKDVSMASGHRSVAKSGQDLSLTMSQQLTSSPNSTSRSSSLLRYQDSKLPVRVGTSSSPGENKPERTRAKDSSVQGGKYSTGKTQSTHPTELSDLVHRRNETSSLGGSTLEKRDINQQSSHTSKSKISKNNLDKSSNASGRSVSRSESSKSGGQSTGQSLSGQARPGSLRKDSANTKQVSQVHFGQDQTPAAMSRSFKSSADPRPKPRSSAERLNEPEQSRTIPGKNIDDRSGDLRRVTNLSSFTSEACKLQDPFPLNIPVSDEKTAKKSVSLEHISNSSTHPAAEKHVEKRKEGEIIPQQHIWQIPPQRLPAPSQCHTSLVSQSQPPSNQETPDVVPSMDTSPTGSKRNQDMETAGTVDLPGPIPPLTFPEISSTQKQSGSKPTLLTGSSLLRTEFAHKYLAPELCLQSASQPSGESASQPGWPLSSQVSNTWIPPDHLMPEGDGGSTVYQHLSMLQLDPTFACSSQQRSLLAHQRAPIPSTSLVTMDESAMSVYYELNEDLGHSTLIQGGGESSALGSFWGKSPLYQSTPALEMGKVAGVSLASRLDERDLITPGNMVTPQVQRQLIDIPRNVDFPQFCCLGVSQKTSVAITNRTLFGVACRFRLVQLLHNGKTVKLDQQSPFEVKPKISIGAGATESVHVLFVPKRPGEHMCQVEVFTQSLNPTLEATTSILQLRAIAEVPHIQISPSVEELQLGEVMWGGCLSKTIRLRNIKRASLPVRLSLWSGTSVWHCFTFDSSDNSSDVSIISMSSRPESLGRNVITVILPGCDSADNAKTVEFSIYCRPPKKDLSCRTLAERSAEHIDAKIDIEVDTPVQFLPSLVSVVLKATVGMPRLLIPPSQMSLMFKTTPNKNLQESLSVNNAGNITLHLSVSVTTFPECFKISPSQLAIKPGAHEQVSVLFSPLETDVYRYQSLLLLEVEPEGPSYEIPLEAHVTLPSGHHPAPLSILTSKSYLSFHGVPLNQTRGLTLRLYNKDQVKAEHACLEIRQSADCFKLVSSSGEWQQKCDVVIEPKEKVTLTLIFCPAAVRGYSGKLVIRKQETHSSKYSIPLSGYGGRSILALSGGECLANSGQRWLELGCLSLTQNIMREVVLTNTGVRAAFVKAASFYDMPCRQPVPPGRVAMEPNNFVLTPGCSMKVMVAISPSQREVDLVKNRKEVVAVVRFQHGDEVMRQKYQRACRRDRGVDAHSWQAAFRQPFANESQDSITLEGKTIADSPDDTSAFFHHTSSQCVALLAQPSSSHEAPAMSVSTVLQAAGHGDCTSPTHDTTYARGEKSGTDPTGQFLVPARPGCDDKDWTVKPDFLALTVGENNQKMLQLINFSKQPLKFELYWPPSSVVPEPQKGELKPRSKMSIDVWLHMAWQQRLSELPWRGAITITCNGQTKAVRVTVQKPVSSPLLSLPSPHSSPNSMSAGSLKDTTSSSGSPRETSSGHSLRLASNSIHFPKAKVNGIYESVLEVTNTAPEPVRWRISAFAPAYVKGSDDTNTVKRVGYTVFTISPSNADLLPDETMKVPIKFCPQTKGTFNQHWEIEYWPLTTGKKAAHTKMATRVSLTAEVSNQDAKKPTWEAVDHDKAGVTSRRTPLQEKQPNTVDTGEERAPISAPELQLMHPDVTFGTTKVGRVTQVKIEFKNSLDHNVDLEVDPPKPPFRIKHKSFKITRRRFLKYPIEFSSSTAGTFADVMVFRAPELGKTFTVHLKGTSV